MNADDDADDEEATHLIMLIDGVPVSMQEQNDPRNEAQEVQQLRGEIVATGLTDEQGQKVTMHWAEILQGEQKTLHDKIMAFLHTENR